MPTNNLRHKKERDIIIKKKKKKDKKEDYFVYVWCTYVYIRVYGRKQACAVSTRTRNKRSTNALLDLAKTKSFFDKKKTFQTLPIMK